MKKFVITKDDYLWLYSKFRDSDRVTISSQDTSSKDWIHFSTFSKAKIITGGSDSFILSDKGKFIINKLRERERVLSEGAPFSIKRRISTSVDIMRTGMWYRFRIGYIKSKWYLSNMHVILAGRAVCTGFPNSKHYFTKNTSGDRMSAILSVVGSVSHLLEKETQLFPYKYQRKNIGDAGFFWYVSNDRKLILPVPEVYYDMITILSNRARIPHRVTSVNYKGKDVVLYRNADAAQTFKVYHDVVAIVGNVKCKGSQSEEEVWD